MDRPYLSYSGYTRWKECPRAYWHSYVDKTPCRDNKVNSLYGSSVGLLFEWFYNDRIWRDPTPKPTLLSRVDEAIRHVMSSEQAKDGGYYDWTDPKASYKSIEKLREDVVKGVCNGLVAVKQYRLLGPDARAEVKLNYTFGDMTMGGRADLIMTRALDKDLVILDGKGTKYRRYLDGGQLKWYAALYRLHHGNSPDRLGYLLWRFQGADSMMWVDFTEADLDELVNDVREAVVAIGKETEFVPSPSRKVCQWCVYRDRCNAGTALIGSVGVSEVSLDY